MSRKYMLIGQGLAGTILSLKLREYGMDHIIVDSPALSSSSRIAAGLINPIVLKRLKKISKAEAFLRELEKFYRHTETLLGKELYFPLSIHHIFHSVAEQNQWMEKSGHAEYNKYLGDVISNTEKNIIAPFGIGKMKNTAYVNTAILIDSYREKLIAEGRLHQKEISLAEIEKLKRSFHIETVILCNGHLMRSLIPDTIPYFSPTRGEILIIESDELPEEQIFHAGIFILPLGNKRFKIGATYHWDNFNDTPTEEAKELLEKGLRKIFVGKYTIVEHLAGVRPNTIDRKPLLGKLGDYYIFNGLGSRGCLMAPMLADILIGNLQHQTKISEEFAINRFDT